MSNRLNSNERYARIGELLRGNPRTACAHVVSLSFLGGSSLPRRSSGRLQHAPQRPRTVDNSALRLCPTHVSFPAASDLFAASARNDSLAAHPPAKPCARTQLLSASEGVGPFFTQGGKCTGSCTPIPGVSGNSIARDSNPSLRRICPSPWQSSGTHAGAHRGRGSLYLR